MHNANENWALEALDRASEADDLEALVADIKSIVESALCPEQFKVQRVINAIREAGY